MAWMHKLNSSFGGVFTAVWHIKWSLWLHSNTYQEKSSLLDVLVILAFTSLEELLRIFCCKAKLCQRENFIGKWLLHHPWRASSQSHVRFLLPLSLFTSDQPLVRSLKYLYVICGTYVTHVATWREHHWSQALCAGGTQCSLSCTFQQLL